MIVTIDGPAGSGKSSVAKELAIKLGFIHLNSGLLYRAVAYLATKLNIPYENGEKLAEIARSTKFDFVLNVGDFRTCIKLIFLPENLLLNPEILLSEEWSQGASKVATLSQVRDVLTEVQREVGSRCNLVLEGRDSGSVVFPDAEYKFYLEASLEERVKRRSAQELKDSEVSDFVRAETEGRMLLEIKKRDLRDSSRKVSPQVVPMDAKVVNTEHLSLEQVVDLIRKEINQ